MTFAWPAEFPRFTTSCNLHPATPDRECVRCRDSRTVNRIGHQRGTCIPEFCVWHWIEQAEREGRPIIVDPFWLED